MHRSLKSIPHFIWIICKWHWNVFFTYSALILKFYMRKYKQKICKIIKFKHTRQYFSCRMLLWKETSYESRWYCLLILISCNIILKRKAKCNYAIYKPFRYCIFTFCFLYSGYFTSWSVMSKLKFYKCSIFCLIKKNYISQSHVVHVIKKKCWFSAALTISAFSLCPIQYICNSMTPYGRCFHINNLNEL